MVSASVRGPLMIPPLWILDSSFLIAALDEAKLKEHAVKAMKIAFAKASARHVTLGVAATVEAEILVADPTCPWLDVFFPVAFDSAVAKKLATLIKQTQPDGTLRGYWKYDAITLACAMSVGAEAVVADDDDYSDLLAKNGITAIKHMWPEEIEHGEVGKEIAKKRRAAERKALQEERERKEREEAERIEAEARAEAERQAHIEKMKREHPKATKNGGAPAQEEASEAAPLKPPPAPDS